MPTLPPEIMLLLLNFAPLLTPRTWQYVPILVAGSILLTPRRRMVSSALRVMGLAQVRWFGNVHRVLNRAVWSGLAVSRVLLGLLIAAFASEGPVVVGLDHTIERRRGAKIAAKGIYHDPVRSSHSHPVKASGLRSHVLDGACPYPVGAAGVGAALPHRVGALGALPPDARAAPQDSPGLGAPDASPAAALAAPPAAGGCGRW